MIIIYITSYHRYLKNLLFEYIDEAIEIFRNMDKPMLERANLFGEEKLEYFFDFENEELLKYFNIIGIEFFLSSEYEDYLYLSHIGRYTRYEDVNVYLNRHDCAFKLILSELDTDVRNYIFFDLLEKYNFCGGKLYEYNKNIGVYEFQSELSYYFLLGEHNYSYDDYYEWEYEWDYDYYQFREDSMLDDEFDRFYNKLDYRRKKHIEHNKDVRKEKLLNKKFLS